MVHFSNDGSRITLEDMILKLLGWPQQRWDIWCLNFPCELKCKESIGHKVGALPFGQMNAVAMEGSLSAMAADKESEVGEERAAVRSYC